MENFIDFFMLRDPNVAWVVGGIICITAAAAIVGTFTLLRKQALIGDAVSHAILPGVCLAFIIAQTKNPMILLIGATISGWLGLLAINYLSDKTKLKGDAALGLVLSVFYGLGIVLLTAIQQSGNAAQAGLDKFLFGKAAALVRDDAITFAIFSFVLITIVFLFYQPFKLVVFDKDYALAKGLPVRRLEVLLSILTVSAIALGIQAVGVVLMAALLIAPAAAARYWTNSLSWMLVLSTVFAILAGLIGTYISYTVPRMPTGPWIVSILSVFALGSIFLGRKKGLLARYLNQRFHKEKMLKENILKVLWHLGEADQNFEAFRSVDQMQERRFIPLPQLRRGSKKLVLEGSLIRKEQKFALSPEGKEEGERIIRIHRMWELYLTTHMNLPADHVHEDAEAIEHVITPEIEAELAKVLEGAEKDPHASPIPYKE
ncbi:MAG: metal ABC transporter permease [Bacteroidia bacterium]|nr:metal ABC transporter permease [Bacteroidia bacterium]